MAGRIKTSLVNLAQILLLVLLIPIFIVISETVSPSSSQSPLLSFLGQIPLFDTISAILSQFTSGITATNIAELTLWVFFKELPAAMIAGVSVHFCIALFNILWQPFYDAFGGSFKPLPILAGFFGIVLSTIITSLIGLSGSALTEFIIEIGVIVIMIFGIRLMFSALRLPKNFFSLFEFLEWILDGIFAVILSIHLVSLVFIGQGGFGDIGKNARFLCLITTITIIAAFIVSIFKIKKEIDKKKK